ncbi:MAG: hypothetical protein AAB710_00450 [Patescibacteria group bacterium]
MITTLTIKLPKQEKEHLERLALRYDLSLQEFSRRVLQELSSEIPEESLREYEKPADLTASLKRALHDWQNGHVHANL